MHVEVTWEPLDAMHGYVLGEAEIKFTNIKDGSSFIINNMHFGIRKGKVDHLNFEWSDELERLEFDKKDITLKYEEPKVKDLTNILKNFEDTPFFFYDLDFDNVKELIIAGRAQGQRYSSIYRVYSLRDGVLVNQTNQVTDIEPFLELDGLSTIDISNKTINIYGSGGACNGWNKTYKFIDRETNNKKGRYVLEKYYQNRRDKDNDCFQMEIKFKDIKERDISVGTIWYENGPKKSEEREIEESVKYEKEGQKVCSDRKDFLAYKFGIKIQQAFREKNLSSLFNYMINEELKSGPRKKDVIGKSFDEVFTDRTKELILSEEPSCSTVGYRGYMLGSGKVWYDFINDGRLSIISMDWNVRPSFDCSKSRSLVENMICSNSDLGTLDYDLSRIYFKKVAITNEGQKQILIDEQRKWIKTRNRCENKSTPSSTHECLKKVYKARINQLKNAQEVVSGKETSGTPLKLNTSWKYQESIDSYKEAIRINPKNDSAHAGLGDTYEKLSQYKDAIASYKEAIHINPENKHAHRDLGAIYEKLERYQDAIASY
jgi:uncharacterized protein